MLGDDGSSSSTSVTCHPALVQCLCTEEHSVTPSGLHRAHISLTRGYSLDRSWARVVGPMAGCPLSQVSGRARPMVSFLRARFMFCGRSRCLSACLFTYADGEVPVNSICKLCQTFMNVVACLLRAWPLAGAHAACGCCRGPCVGYVLWGKGAHCCSWADRGLWQASNSPPVYCAT